MRKKVLSIFLLVFVAVSSLVCAFAVAGEIHEAARKGRQRRDDRDGVTP